MEAIQHRGALVAEVPMGTRPQRQQFPRRNRLISGLARAVVVVEGDVDSGALITARCGLAQGRQVFAVPGSIHARASRGPHRLLAQGARLLGTPSDLFEELSLPQVAEISPTLTLQVPGAGALEGRLLTALGDETLHIDTVITRSGLRPAEAAAVLANLEVRGLVRQLPGKHFARCRRPGEVRGEARGASWPTY